MFCGCAAETSAYYMKSVNYDLDMSVTTFLVDFDTIHETTQNDSPERMPKKVVTCFNW